MLKELWIKNFILIDATCIHFDLGMTSITGESGTGKSILIDALGLCLGMRMLPSMRREADLSCEISAVFQVNEHSALAKQLRQNDLLAGETCTLSRILLDNKSKSLINGRPVSLQLLKSIGQQLVTIHTQHASQKLLQREQQRMMLDEFSGTIELAEEINALSQAYQAISNQINHLTDEKDTLQNRAELLGYQLEELAEFELSENHLDQIQEEQLFLSRAQENADWLIEAKYLIDSDEASNLMNQITQLSTLLHRIQDERGKSESLSSQVKGIEVNARELYSDIVRLEDFYQSDPERLASLNEELANLWELTRKHQCDLVGLESIKQRIEDELAQISDPEQSLEALKLQKNQMEVEYQTKAPILSQKRLVGAQALEDQVNGILSRLNMQGLIFSIVLEALSLDQIGVTGGEMIEFLIHNPGQKPSALKQSISGGELSRLSLAIQVALSISARGNRSPTFVFDEIDTGISGAVTEEVGRFLLKMQANQQVFCITHQASIAARAQNQFWVDKQIINGKAQAFIQRLSAEERANYLARMMGGDPNTALLHAKEMLKN